jgi:GT2 family glycosyltransferase
MLKKPEILISILTYNSTYFIEDCLLSIKNQTSQNFKCFLFDNNSTDNIKEVVSKYKFVEFIQVGKNDGYTGGHNFAFNYFKQNYPKHQYILVLNPDVELETNLLEEYEKLFEKEDVELYSSPVKNPKDNSLHVFKNIHLPSFTFLGKQLKDSEIKKDYINIMFVLGSCFIVNLNKYKSNYLFKDYFMYHDEIELSLRVKLEGGKVLSVTKSSTIHNSRNIHKRTDKVELSDKVVYLLELNRLKLQSDLLSNLFVFLNLPLYIFSRFLITILYKPFKHYKYIFKGLLDGIIYFIKNSKKGKANFYDTLNLIFIENSKYNA